MIPGNDNNGGQERRTLWIVLLLNAAIAAGFFVSGFFADSSALIANGVDNLSDTAVYALSLVALTRGQTWKTRAAVASGVMLASPQGLFARQRFLGHKRNMGYATRFNRAIGSLSGWNSPAGSRLACSQR